MVQAVETLRLVSDTQRIVSPGGQGNVSPDGQGNVSPGGQGIVSPDGHQQSGLNGHPTDWAEIRNYRRLLRDALTLAQEARQNLTDAQRRIATLEHLSRTDETTGLLNRRGFELALETALARVKRHGEQGVLVMIDLDGFKAINDRHGHAVGDLVLATVGTILNRHTRFTDSAARIGGDEFALILTDTDDKGAKLRVRKLDQILNCSDVPWNGMRIPIRASFGYAPYGLRDQADSLFAKADAAMYERKRDRAVSPQPISTQ